MKKLMLLCLLGGLTFGVSIFSMEMDTSDDEVARTLASLESSPSASVPHTRSAFSGIPAPIRKIIVEEYSIHPDNTEGMAKILSAMGKEERNKLVKFAWDREEVRLLMALSDTSDDSDSEETESSDKDDVEMVEISDEELDFLDKLEVGEQEPKSKLKPKDKKRSELSSQAFFDDERVVASCEACFSKLYENMRKKKGTKKPNPLSGQKIFHSRQEGRCLGYPDCIKFHAVAEKYPQCFYCLWLFAGKENGSGVTNHMRKNHPGKEFKLKKPKITYY